MNSRNEMKANTKNRNVKIHKADLALQEKIGTGQLDERTIARCQKVIDNNNVDFAPLAFEFLANLEVAIKTANKDSVAMENAVQNMTTPVMQLKANASTFRYLLIGNLANVMLSFLETIKQLDKDSISIVAAHHKTLKAIVQNKMAGHGGTIGKKMENELRSACKRYFSKRRK